MARRICCPIIFLQKHKHCSSVNQNKIFRWKSCCRWGLFNPLGTIIGAASGINGKRGKTKFLCQDCGKVFERKI